MSGIDRMKKIVVFGIIFLFIGIGFSTVVTAYNNEINNSYKAIDSSNDSGASDDYEEIITLIGGIGSITLVKRLGLFLCEVRISTFIPFGGSISVTGLRRSNGHLEIFHEIGNMGYVNASRFMGFCLPREVGSYITGIAFGNIEYKITSLP